MKTSSRVLIVVAVLALAVYFFLDKEVPTQPNPSVIRETNSQDEVFELALKYPQEDVELVHSEGGGASLAIPAGALPEGVSIEDIKIYKSPSEEEGAVIYTLEPSGTVFNKPVTAIISLDGFREEEGFAMPLLSLVSGDTEEMIDEVDITIDLAANNLQIQAQITHFSYLKAKKDTMMVIVLNSPSGSYPLKSTVPVEGHIKRMRKDTDLSNFSVRVFMREVPDDTILTPTGLVKVISKPQNLAYNEKLDFYSKKYICDEAGKTTIKVLLPVRFDIDSVYKQFLYKFYIYSDLIECEAGKTAEVDDTSLVLPEDDSEGEEIGFAVVEFDEEDKDNDTTPTKDEPIIFEDWKVGLISISPEYEMAFDHTKPWQYSEVYLSVTNLLPGEKVTATLKGPAVDSPSKQTITADEEGVAHFTWKITQFGTYNVHIQHHSPNEVTPVGPTANLGIIVN